MDKILQTIESVNGEINGVVWGAFGLLLLVGTGIIVTVLTKFFQVTHIGLWFKNTLGSLLIRTLSSTARKRVPYLRSRHFVLPLQQLSELVTSPALLQLFVSAVRAQCSGCGLPHSSV